MSVVRKMREVSCQDANKAWATVGSILASRQRAMSKAML